MAVNLKLGVNSGNTGRIERRRSLARRRSIQPFEEPQFQPIFEWLETPQAHILKAELPGFKKENVSVHIDLYRNLTVRGERPTEVSEGERLMVSAEVAAESWRPLEKPRRQFRRVINVPDNVDTSSITATFHNEILYITAPKLNPTSQTRSIEITDLDHGKNDKPASNVKDQGIKSDQTPLDDGAKPSAVKEKETQFDGKKTEDLAKDTADQCIKSDQTPLNDGAQPSVVKEKETQLDNEKSEELAKDTTTGSGISQDKSAQQKSESVKSEQGNTEVVKPSELGEKSHQEKMVEKPTEHTKIDPSLAVEESLPPPLEEKKEKSEAKTQEVQGKEYGSGAVDEKPKLETHEIKEEKLSSDANESEITQAGKETVVPRIFLSKMRRSRVLVVSAIVVFYLVLYISYRLRSADD